MNAEDIARLLKTSRQFDPASIRSEFPYPHGLFVDPPRPAAVLIPLLCKDHGWHVLFTRRNPTLAEHSGQVAFPGGRSEPEDDSPEATALREAREEIGLAYNDVSILGKFQDFHTISNYRITPIVGVIPWPYPFRIEVEEVSRVFTIPLDWLADPFNYETRRCALPEPYPPVNVVYFRSYDGEVLWGVSARLTLTFLEILGLANGKDGE